MDEAASKECQSVDAAACTKADFNRAVRCLIAGILCYVLPVLGFWIPPHWARGHEGGAGFQIIVVALVLFFLGPVCAIIAVRTGRNWRKRLPATRTPRSAKTLAYSGLTLGYANLALWAVLALFMLASAILLPRGNPEPPELAVMGALRTIATAQVAFSAAKFFDMDSDGVGDYGTLSELADPPTGPPFLDHVLALGEKDGYRFSVTVDTGGMGDEAYTVLARPTRFGKTGARSFYMDESGVIRFTYEDRPATADDKSLE